MQCGGSEGATLIPRDAQGRLAASPWWSYAQSGRQRVHGVPPALATAMNSADTVTGSREYLSTAQALLQLTKPRVTRMVLVTMACGAFVAPGGIAFGSLLLGMAATALVVGAANALNMYIERDSDGRMERTRQRPLPAGRLSPDVALWFGIALGAVGVVVLAACSGLLAAALAALAWASYVLVYTPLKPLTPYAVHVGALPGAIPPLIGSAVACGAISLHAWFLFAILFIWQLPHFLAISVFRQAEYERAGIAVLPARRGLRATKRAIVGYAAATLAASLLPTAMGAASLAYGVLAGVLGAIFLAWALWGLGQQRGAAWARSLFIASLPYLVLLYGGLVTVSV